MREDWDFKKGEKGKGYHVSASLGDRKVAFCKEGGGLKDDYRDRTKILGERYHHDGPEEVAKWYVPREERNPLITEPQMKYHGRLTSGRGDGHKYM